MILFENPPLIPSSEKGENIIMDWNAFTIGYFCNLKPSPSATAGGDKGGVTLSVIKLTSAIISFFIRKTPLCSPLLCKGEAAVQFAAILVFLFINTVSFAQVQLELEPRKITVGDPVELTLSLPVPDDASVILPTPESFAPAEIIKIDTLRISEEEISVRYTLSAFEPGKIELDKLHVILNYENENDTLNIKAGTVVVESVLDPADSSMEIKDIHPPMKLFWTFMDVLPYLIVIAALIIVSVAAWIIWRKIKIRRGEIVPVGPPPPPPHTVALRRLENLRIKKLWQNGYLKEYYSELTEILKEYIGGRYKINAPEMTTYELLKIKNKWADNDEYFKQVKRIVTSGDLVKFARYKADPHENDSNLKQAFEYVDLTKPDIENNKTENSKKREMTDA